MKTTKLTAVLSAAALLALVGCAAEAEDPEVEQPDQETAEAEEEQTDEETVEEQAEQLTSLTGEERAAYRDDLTDDEVFALIDVLAQPYEEDPEVEEAPVAAAEEAVEEHADFFTPRDEDTSPRMNPGSYYEASISVVGDHDGGEVSSDEITDQVCDYMEAVVADVAAADVTEWNAHDVKIDVEIRHSEEPTVHSSAGNTFSTDTYNASESCQ